ncbi:MAG: hypothetical protein K2L46_05640, partial [Paramuribaculum sp.]|nr:hypothetical protein [Paramuribaculum sp.]
LTAGEAHVRVGLLPLIHKQIEIRSISLSDATYRLGTPDSALYLKARIDNFSAGDTDIPISFSRIALGNAVLDGADVELTIRDTTETTPPDTTASRPLQIDAGDIRLRNITYRMNMLPVIDSLGVRIGSATLQGGHVDTGRRQIQVGVLSVDSVSAAYLTPDAAYLSKHTAPQPDSTATGTISKPWTISARKLRLTARDGLYATRGAVPAKGIDPAYIAVRNVVLEVDSFYNQGSSIRIPLRHFSAEERCGIPVMASGTFTMDSVAITADNFNFATARSNLYMTASMGTGNIMADPSLPLGIKANGIIAMQDIASLMPALNDIISALPASAGLQLNTDIHGSASSLDIDRLFADIPGYFRVNATGHINNPLDFNKMRGNIDLNGNLGKINAVKNRILPRATASEFNIPPMDLKGSVNYSPGNIDGVVDVRTTSGKIALDGRWNAKAEGYKAKVNAVNFPVKAFMPSLGIGNLTADIDIDGHGYNPASRKTRITAAADLHSVEYNGATLGNIRLNAAIDTCRLTADIVSDNNFADFDADLAAMFDNGGYRWDLSSDIRHLDLQAMNLFKQTMNGSATIYTSGVFYPRSGNIDAEIDVNGLDWTMDSLHFAVPGLTAKLSSTDSLTHANLVSGDLNADLTAFSSLMAAIGKIPQTSALLNRQIERREINIDSLQRALPEMALRLDMGRDNPAYDYLSSTSGLEFNNAQLTFSNDSLISLHAVVDGFRSGSVKLDNISFDANQHGKYLVYNTRIDNRPGTMDDFAHVILNGYLADDKLSAMIRQSNIKGDQGFLIGFNAAVSDSTVAVRFIPANPTIAYRKWTINNDNIIA